MNFFKKKSRTELVEERAESIVSDLFISGFSPEEIANIIFLAKKNAKHRLEERQKEIDLELLNINNAINLL